MKLQNFCLKLFFEYRHPVDWVLSMVEYIFKLKRLPELIETCNMEFIPKLFGARIPRIVNGLNWIKLTVVWACAIMLLLRTINCVTVEVTHLMQ